MSSDVNDRDDDERTDPHIVAPKSQPAPAAVPATPAAPPRASSPPPLTGSRPLAGATTTIGAMPKMPMRSIDATRPTDPSRPPMLPVRPAASAPPPFTPPAAERASDVPLTSSLTAAMLIPRPSSVHPPPMGGRISDPGAGSGDPLRERLAQVEVSMAATRSIATRVEAEAGRAHARLDTLATTIDTTLRERAAQLEGNLETAKKALEARVEQITSAGARAAPTEEPTDGSMKTALATLRQTIAEHERQFEARRARVESVETRVASLDPKLVELRRATESFDLRLLALERAQEALRSDVDARVRAMEARLSEGPATGTRKAAAAEPELRRIKGVGPKYEKALREMGITTIAQVAAMGETELVQLAGKLSVPVERIRKLGWPETARALLAE